ncbi:MAG: hypothetical protein AABY15_06445 [Nanoarchaeota archaeon]
MEPIKEETIREEILTFLSRHEIIISDEMEEKDIDARFTTFGTRAGCRAIYEIIETLDDDAKLKVIEMMKNKRI